MSSANLSQKPALGLIPLPRVFDNRGNLSFIEGMTHVPFAIKRVFYLYDIPGGTDRGGHALKTCEQFVIAITGSFDVKVDTGALQQTFQLTRSYYGLYIPPLSWRELGNFCSGSVCLVLASHPYDESDYIRDHEVFKETIR